MHRSKKRRKKGRYRVLDAFLWSDGINGELTADMHTCDEAAACTQTHTAPDGWRITLKLCPPPQHQHRAIYTRLTHHFPLVPVCFLIHVENKLLHNPQQHTKQLKYDHAALCMRFLHTLCLF